jgi:hypothetical protein
MLAKSVRDDCCSEVVERYEEFGKLCQRFCNHHYLLFVLLLLGIEGSVSDSKGAKISGEVREVAEVIYEKGDLKGNDRDCPPS